MILRSLTLQHFRSYKKAEFTFSPTTTVILGMNTAGKSNLLESLFLLASGKSFRAEKDLQMIAFGAPFARVLGVIEGDDGTEHLEVAITDTNTAGSGRAYAKKLLRNGVPKRRSDFAGTLPALLFVPSDLDIITSSPSNRRHFLDAVLEVTDRNYRVAQIAYEKALRQRNALLELVKETGVRNAKQFAYWDELLISHGNYITKKREELIAYFLETKKSLIEFSIEYDHSKISEERLLQYRFQEEASGNTLVGPHRDDFSVFLIQRGVSKDVRSFGSRGQQRLVILQLKLLQLTYMEKVLGERPLLLLDDIFSELDQGHIEDVLEVIKLQQTVLSTTHEEFLKVGLPDQTKIIELEKDTDKVIA
jgi:DNA replication and repair protein RecF